MSYPFGDKSGRFGTADWSKAEDVIAAGMYEQTDTAIYCGEFEGRSLFYDGQGGIVLCAGARSGKLRDILFYSLSKHVFIGGSLICFDMKGELASTSMDQTRSDGRSKSVILLNPRGMHGLPSHRINPVSYLRADSPTLVADLKVFLENWIPATGSANARYFEQNARRWAEAICLFLIGRDGCLHLSEFYRVVNLISGGGDRWKDIAFEMYRSDEDIIRDTEEQIASMREDRSGGFSGIIGELERSVACLSDPQLREAVSGPFDMEVADLCNPDHFTQLYLVVPMEMVELWAPVLKSFFVAVMIEKGRRPTAPKILALLDEVGQLGRFPLVPKLFTYGAGIGVQPFAVFQNVKQMNDLAPNAQDLILSSAALQMYFAIREPNTAKMVSEMLGTQTLSYDDELVQSRARSEREQLAASLLAGADPFRVSFELMQKTFEAGFQREQQRNLENPDELMRLGDHKMIIFADGLKFPLLVDRKAYYLAEWMAGAFLPNQYHPPLDSVQIMTANGEAVRPVITGPVPSEFAHLPQYKDGLWTYVEGFTL